MGLTQHWKNTDHNGLFSDNKNWTPGPVPGAADTAVIDLAGTYTVTSTTSVAMTQLAILATATLDITSSTSFTVTGGTAAGGIAGTVLVENASTLYLGGAVTDTGTIRINAGANTTSLIVDGPTLTLTGGGNLVLAGTGNAYVYGTTGTSVLNNVADTISGTGFVGDNQLTLQNGASGTINANQSSALTLATGSNFIVNAGLLEGTNTGGLVINSAVDQRSGTGRILASGAGATVSIGGSIIGGTLSTQNGGLIVASANNQGVLDGQGTHAVTNAGTLSIGNGVYFYVAGTINNTGTIALGGTTSATNLIADSGFTLLTGGGHVTLSNDANNRIYGANGNWTLDNVNNTISGAGQIGVNQMRFINSGTVNANQAVALQLYFNNIAVNTGLIEATDTAAGNGGLQLLNSTLDNAGGVVLASGTNAHVDLQSSAILGGTLQTALGGLIQTIAGTSGLDGQTDGAITNTGTLQINDATTLNLAGSIINSGTLFVDATSTNNSTNLVVNGGVATLTGGGHVTLSDNINNRIYGNSLVNVDNTIAGAGQIGVNQMVFTNGAAGVVDATGFNQLQLYFNTAAVNAGLLEATNTAVGNGGLVIFNSTISNAGGTILASGANAHVDLSGAYIEGGTISSANGGVVHQTANSSLDGITDGALTIKGTVQVNDNTQLSLLGTINNTGTLFQDAVSTSNTTYVHIAYPLVTLTGGGHWVMSDSDNNLVYGGGNTLVNVNNTISGAGDIGDNQLLLINQAGGVINANQATSAVAHQSGVLYLYTGNTTQNLGILEATNTGGLNIDGGAVNNAGGIIQAVGTGAHVDLSNSTTIEGGTLTSSGTGAVIQTLTGNTGGLDGFTHGAITNTGTVKVDDNSTLALSGVIINKGNIFQDAVTGTDIAYIHLLTVPVTLQGGGTLTMSNDIYNEIYGNELINVDNTISGAGNIGLNQTQIINQAAGVIDANAPLVTGSASTTGVLTLQSNVRIQNAGLMEATNGGELQFYYSGVINTGTIQAGTGSVVALNNSTIYGGTLTTAGSGVIQTIGSSALDGVSYAPIVNHGTVLVQDNTTLTLDGTINNTGTIFEDGTIAGDNTNLVIGSAFVRLTGGGRLVLSNLAGNRIYGNASNFELDNVNNIISGAGQLGVGQTVLLNSGTINANQTLALNVNTGAQTLTNAAGGVIEGTGTGGLVIQSGILQNLGTIGAFDGSSVLLQSGVYNTNAELGELTGGIWRASAAGHGATLSITGGPVVTDSATILLNGAGSVIQAGDGNIFTTLENSLTTISSVGTLAVTGNRGYTTTLAITDNGVLQLGGGIFTASGLAIGTTGKLLGFGTVTHGVASNGLVEANGGLLLLSGTLAGPSALQADAGATLQLASNTPSATDSTMITLNGAGSEIEWGTGTPTKIEAVLTTIATGATFSVLGGRGYTTTLAIADSGLITLAGGTFQSAALSVKTGGKLMGSGTVTPAVADAGTIEASGGVLKLSGGTTGTGALVVDPGATLELAGATNAATITDNGILKLDGIAATATTTTVAAAAQVTGFGSLAGAVTNAGTIAANGGTLTLSGHLAETGTLTTAAGATLALSGGGSLAGSVTGAGKLDLTGGAYTTAGNLTVASAVINAANVTVGSGTLAFTGVVTNTGSIATGANTVTFAALVSGGGSVGIGAGGTAFYHAGSAAGALTNFLAATGTLDLTTPASFAGTIGGFVHGDTIDLVNTLATGKSFAAGVLTVTGAGGTLASLHMTGALTTASFNLGTDSHGGTLITHV